MGFIGFPTPAMRASDVCEVARDNRRMVTLSMTRTWSSAGCGLQRNAPGVKKKNMKRTLSQRRRTLSQCRMTVNEMVAR